MKRYGIGEVGEWAAVRVRQLRAALALRPRVALGPPARWSALRAKPGV